MTLISTAFPITLRFSVPTLVLGVVPRGAQAGISFFCDGSSHSEVLMEVTEECMLQ